jgi:hypothetical protein
MLGNHSLYITTNKTLYFGIYNSHVCEHLPLSEWKRKIFGLPVDKIIDNTHESPADTFLDKQLKQLQN